MVEHGGLLVQRGSECLHERIILTRKDRSRVDRDIAINDPWDNMRRSEAQPCRKRIRSGATERDRERWQCLPR